MTLTRHAIDAHVEKMLDAAARTGDEAIARLGAGAYDELHTWPEIDIVARPATDPLPMLTTSSCDMAGAYLTVAGRPTLIIAHASTARMNFTALHELGHHLQQTDEDLFLTLFDSPDSVELEEAACDHFAARILLPEHLIDEHCRAGVTADAVAALWRATSASRSAVCIAASRRLPAPGHVLLLDADGTTVIDANRELPRVSRGSEQSSHPVIARGLRATSHAAEGQGALQYRDGIRGAELFTQTGDIGGYLVAVAVLDSAPWRRLSIPTYDPGPQARWRDCEHCSESYRSFARPCTRCGAVACTECGRCNCTVPERRCDTCFMVQPLASFEGTSTLCLSCS